MQLIQILLPFLASSSLVAGAVINDPIASATTSIVNVVNIIANVSQGLNRTASNLNANQASAEDSSRSLLDGLTTIVKASRETNLILKITKSIADAAEQQLICKATDDVNFVENKILPYYLSKTWLTKIPPSSFLKPVAQELRMLEKKLALLEMKSVESLRYAREEIVKI